MQEQETHFTSDGNELAGTMALPDAGEPFPAVLLLPGSGQLDRDGNRKKLPMNVLRDISSFMARNGMASFRYDKRGVGQSAGDHWKTGFYDHVQDARAALQHLKDQKSIRPESTFVLGHSEGALIAVRMAGAVADIAGAILLAGAAQPGAAVMKWQALQVAGGLKGFSAWLIRTLHIDVSAAQRKQLEKIKRSNRDTYRRNLFVRINARWMREFMEYDPAQDLSRMTAPAIAIIGSKDIQVDPADLERMAQLVKAPFEHRLIPDMTHMLRTEAGEASISNYKEEIERPVEPELLETVLGWLRKRTAESLRQRSAIRGGRHQT